MPERFFFRALGMLTPRLQMAVRLLQMSALDYEQELHALMAKNPFLEVDESVLDRSPEANEFSAADVSTEAAQTKADVDGDGDSGGVTVGGMKLSTTLMYSGNPREAADQVSQLEKAGLDTIWVAEAYGFDAPTLMGYLAAKTETIAITVSDGYGGTSTITLTAPITPYPVINRPPVTGAARAALFSATLLRS